MVTTIAFLLLLITDSFHKTKGVVTRSNAVTQLPQVEGAVERRSRRVTGRACSMLLHLVGLIL